MKTSQGHTFNKCWFWDSIQVGCLPRSWPLAFYKTSCLWSEKEAYSIFPFNWQIYFISEWDLKDIFPAYTILPGVHLPVSSLQNTHFPSKSDIRGLQDMGQRFSFVAPEPGRSSSLVHWTVMVLRHMDCWGLLKVSRDQRISHDFCHLVEKLECSYF